MSFLAGFSGCDGRLEGFRTTDLNDPPELFVKTVSGILEMLSVGVASCFLKTVCGLVCRCSSGGFVTRVGADRLQTVGQQPDVRCSVSFRETCFPGEEPESVRSGLGFDDFVLIL